MSDKSVKITPEIADAEIEEWLDVKKVRPSTRETNKDSIENMKDAVVEGILRVNENKTLTHFLLEPVGEEKKITELTYKTRLNDRMKIPYMKGIKSDDVFGMLNGTIAALTTTPREVIMAMDTEDKRLAQAIAVFFI